jgi:hypothetical protein
MFEFFFNPTASATAYGQRPKFVTAEHSATAEGENCAYGPTLHETILKKCQMIAMMFTYDFLFLFQYSTLQDLEFNFENRKYNRNQRLPRP